MWSLLKLFKYYMRAILYYSILLYTIYNNDIMWINEL